jgi:hypothetical protein
MNIKTKTNVPLEKDQYFSYFPLGVNLNYSKSDNKLILMNRHVSKQLALFLPKDLSTQITVKLMAPKHGIVIANVRKKIDGDFEMSPWQNQSQKQSLAQFDGQAYLNVLNEGNDSRGASLQLQIRSQKDDLNTNFDPENLYEDLAKKLVERLGISEEFKLEEAVDTMLTDFKVDSIDYSHGLPSRRALSTTPKKLYAVEISRSKHTGIVYADIMLRNEMPSLSYNSKKEKVASVDFQERLMSAKSYLEKAKKEKLDEAYILQVSAFVIDKDEGFEILNYNKVGKMSYVNKKGKSCMRFMIDTGTKLLSIVPGVYDNCYLQLDENFGGGNVG